MTKNSITNPIHRIILAPMEGVLDGIVRKLLTELNQFDYCVTEFVRVTTALLPKKTFYRLCPELLEGGKTFSGTPIRIQLLGQHPDILAANAERAIELGSYGIDINAGCPAKTVTGSNGGASLLKTPELIYQITRKIRESLSAGQPVSVKMRLGWDNKSHCIEIAEAIASGGANEVIVHGRIKEDGYQADSIDWQIIGQIRQKLTIPVIANGEIMSEPAAHHCYQQSSSSDIMLGRGILQTPNLSNIIRFGHPAMPWPAVLDLFINYASSKPISHYRSIKPFYHASRIKQWISYLKITYPAARCLQKTIRSLKTNDDIIAALTNYRTDFSNIPRAVI